MSTSTILPTTQPIEGDLHATSLAQLHQTLVDVREGIDRSIDKTDPDVRAMLKEFRDMHEAHDRAIAMRLARHGHEPDERSGFMGLLHSSAIRMNDWFDRDHDDAVRHIIDGEHEVIKRYNDALERGQPADVIELLSAQREELAALTDRHDPTVTTR